jgi:hypothetical protein
MKHLAIVIILILVASTALIIPMDILSWLFAAYIIGAIVYLTRVVFKLFNIDGKLFGFLKPWKALSPNQQLKRDLFFGVPLILITFLLSKSPFILVVGIVILMGDIVRIFKE